MSFWDGRYLASGVVIVEVGEVVVQGAIRGMRFPAGNATTTSGTSIPGGSRIVYAAIQIVDVYSPGATLLLGHAGDTSLLMAASDINTQKLGTRSIDLDVLFPGIATEVQLTVLGAPIVGSCIVFVRHSQPEA